MLTVTVNSLKGRLLTLLFIYLCSFAIWVWMDIWIYSPKTPAKHCQVFLLKYCPVTATFAHLLLTRDPLVEYDIWGRVCNILQDMSTILRQKQRNRRSLPGTGNILPQWHSEVHIWKDNSCFYLICLLSAQPLMRFSCVSR